jgi:uncharacterized membrane protein
MGEDGIELDACYHRKENAPKEESLVSDLKSVGNKKFLYYLFILLMIIGLSLIGLSVASWIQNVLAQQRFADVLKPDPGLSLFWRVLASATGNDYFYAILGVVLCLLAIHMSERQGLNKLIPILFAFALINAVVLVISFLGFVFVMDWGKFWSPPYFSAIVYIVRFLVEVSAFTAILVVEMPESWVKPWSQPTGDTDLRPTEE